MWFRGSGRDVPSPRRAASRPCGRGFCHQPGTSGRRRPPRCPPHGPATCRIPENVVGRSRRRQADQNVRDLLCLLLGHTSLDEHACVPNRPDRPDLGHTLRNPSTPRSVTRSAASVRRSRSIPKLRRRRKREPGASASQDRSRACPIQTTPRLLTWFRDHRRGVSPGPNRIPSCPCPGRRRHRTWFRARRYCPDPRPCLWSPCRCPCRRAPYRTRRGRGQPSD